MRFAMPVRPLTSLYPTLAADASKYKTRICNKWEEFGRCRLGE